MLKFIVLCFAPQQSYARRLHVHASCTDACAKPCSIAEVLHWQQCLSKPDCMRSCNLPHETRGHVLRPSRAVRGASGTCPGCRTQCPRSRWGLPGAWGCPRPSACALAPPPGVAMPPALRFAHCRRCGQPCCCLLMLQTQTITSGLADCVDNCLVRSPFAQVGLACLDMLGMPCQTTISLSCHGMRVIPCRMVRRTRTMRTSNMLTP